MRTSTGHQLTSNDLFHMEKSVWRRGKVLVQDQINFTFSLHWPTATLPPSTTVTSHSMSYSTRYTVFVILQTLEGVTLDQQTKYLEYSPIKPELHPDPYLFWLYEKRCTFVQVKIPSTHFSVGQQILIQVKIDPYHQGRKLVSIAFKLIQTQEWACTGHSASRVISV
ncbi:hypothetical protein BDB01DRAFT_793580 [Pilobolus umbonatus]|nr:hypothetical protein BDB01DRAFT_793580 [Pilobolus umbonatus]